MAGRNGLNFQADLHSNARTVSPTTKFGRITLGEKHISRGQWRLYRNGWCPSFPNLGVPVHQIWHGNTLGGLLGGQPGPTPRGWGHSGPQF